MKDPLTASIVAERQRRGTATSATKRCTGCGKQKALDEFTRDRRRLSGRGRASRCLSCEAQRARQYRAANGTDTTRAQRSAAHNAALRELGRRHRDELQRLYAMELGKRGLDVGSRAPRTSRFVD